MPTIALVSCVKEKAKAACEARYLYTSSLFRKSSKYATVHADLWFILSAKYGLVGPDDVIEPYEQTLKDDSVAERRRWADAVYQQIEQRGLLTPDASFLWLADRAYQEHLARLLGEFE